MILVYDFVYLKFSFLMILTYMCILIETYKSKCICVLVLFFIVYDIIKNNTIIFVL